MTEIRDQTYTLDRLQSLFVYDNTDGDLAGAHIWGTGPYAMAFGQNSENANAAAPSIDLGYTALPGREFIDLVLKVDKTASPVLVPTAAGSQSTYTLTVNSANFTVDDIVVTDTLPANWAYVADSTTITLADKSQITGAAANPDRRTAKFCTWWQATTLGDMAQEPGDHHTVHRRTTAGFALGDRHPEPCRGRGHQDRGRRDPDLHHDGHSPSTATATSTVTKILQRR